MALLNILRYPDARLHKVAVPVTAFDESLKRLGGEFWRPGED